MDKEYEDSPKDLSNDIVGSSFSQVSTAPVGRENLSDALPPHESYEGRHRYDPAATWTQKEERRVVWKTDIYLLSWICLMVCPSSFT